MPRIDSIASAACFGHSSTAARSSAALNEPARRLPAIPTICTDPKQASGVAAHDLALVRSGKAFGPADEIDRMLHPHVVRIVGAEHHVVGAIALDHVPEHRLVEGDGVEIELLE